MQVEEHEQCSSLIQSASVKRKVSSTFKEQSSAPRGEEQVDTGQHFQEAVEEVRPLREAADPMEIAFPETPMSSASDDGDLEESRAETPVISPREGEDSETPEEEEVSINSSYRVPAVVLPAQAPANSSAMQEAVLAEAPTNLSRKVSDGESDAVLALEAPKNSSSEASAAAPTPMNSPSGVSEAALTQEASSPLAVLPPAARLAPQLWVEEQRLQQPPVLADTGGPPTTATGPGDGELLMDLSGGAWTGAAGWFSRRASEVLVQTRNATGSSGKWILLTVILTIFILVCICMAPNLHVFGMRQGQAGGGDAAKPAVFGIKMPVSRVSVPSLGQLTTTQPSRRTVPSKDAPMPQMSARSPRDPRNSVDAFLCPGLVVPSGCECTLRVPRLTPQFQPKMTKTNMTQVTIDDVKGVPVFRASFCLPSTGSSPASTSSKDLSRFDQGSRCLVLTSTTSEATVFAFCRDSRAELGFEPAALAIHNASGRPFGSLRLCRDKGVGGGFEVVTEAGFWVHLTSNENGLLTAIDRQGRSLAAAEPAQGKPALRTVRIGPLVDAGLLTLSILASDLMEGALAAEAAAAGSRRSTTTPPSQQGAWKL